MNPPFSSSLYSRFSEHVDDECKHILNEPELLIQQGFVIKDDKSTTVVKVELNGRYYIVKRFNARDYGHRLKRALRKTRAKCCWEMSHEFSNAGLMLPKPIAMFERQYGVFKGESYFISEFIDGQELLTWLPEQKQAMIKQASKKIQKMFATFYQNRLSHGDMKATNLLWSQGDIFLIDLDVSRKHFFQLTFKRAHARDKRRFCRNGDLFEQVLCAQITD